MIASVYQVVLLSVCRLLCRKDLYKTLVGTAMQSYFYFAKRIWIYSLSWEKPRTWRLRPSLSSPNDIILRLGRHSLSVRDSRFSNGDVDQGPKLTSFCRGIYMYVVLRLIIVLSSSFSDTHMFEKAACSRCRCKSTRFQNKCELWNALAFASTLIKFAAI